MPPKRQRNRQRKRDKQLQKRSSGDRDPFAEESEQQMPALVDRNKNQIEPLKQMAARGGISDQQDVKNEPAPKHRTRNQLPFFRERIEKWKPFAERFRNIHGSSFLPASRAGSFPKPCIDAARRSHALGDRIHHFTAAIHAIATGKIFFIPGLVPGIGDHRAVLA